MNTSTMPVNETKASEEAITANNAKHRKSSRFFPEITDIKPSDRFTVAKGSSIFCSALSSTIILHEDIKVEITGYDKDVPTYARAFTAQKLRTMGDGSFSYDSKFGILDLNYTDLKAWHYSSEK